MADVRSGTCLEIDTVNTDGVDSLFVGRSRLNFDHHVDWATLAVAGLNWRVDADEEAAVTVVFLPAPLSKRSQNDTEPAARTMPTFDIDDLEAFVAAHLWVAEKWATGTHPMSTALSFDWPLGMRSDSTD